MANVNNPYQAPFEYDSEGTRIIDANGMHCLDLRGWGMLTGGGTGGIELDNVKAARMQDDFGRFVASLLNIHKSTLDRVINNGMEIE